MHTYAVSYAWSHLLKLILLVLLKHVVIFARTSPVLKGTPSGDDEARSLARYMFNDNPPYFMVISPLWGCAGCRL